ncbi:MAG: response regulator [Lentisphaerae bacterium]|jgi:FixJ family two-component response regulator|nr:response regulator [Lentisphaerota bacterium]MBT4822777.1 response regulator [Lentisphaerota bacterium]MBT5606885.1 response regulator [Lentisphaerota bacterium]MBT7058331.1 response regulator [Lentisphaerota bacterium]MBT7843604.1 response regulator [Lentisphaerota bacterium]
MSEPNHYTILIVDDDSSFRQSLIRQFWLMRDSFSVQNLEAGNGMDARRMLAENHVDCVLLDYRMPGGSGLEWLGQFLELDPGLAVVMVTGEGDEQTAVAALHRGAMDYLVKGAFTREGLERAVVNAIDKVRMRRALGEAEKQRVMLESLGAACHHLGQPATVIRTYLELMQGGEQSDEMQQMISRCLESAGAIADILHQLQKVSQYRTVPYLTGMGEDSRCKTSIIDIGSDQAGEA